jgi:hypothetical protein
MNPQKPFCSVVFLITSFIILLAFSAWFWVYATPKQDQYQIHLENINTASSTDETADWETYKNDKYGFEFKYPNSWELSSLPKDSWDGLVDKIIVIPSKVNDPYCNVSEEYETLKENYKLYNSFVGYEKYANELSRHSCTVSVQIENNQNYLAPSDFFTKNYLPFSHFVDGGEEDMKRVISMFPEIGDIVYPRKSFAKFMGGMSGELLTTTVDSDAHQFIVGNGKYLFIVTVDTVEILSEDKLFKEVDSTFKFTN